MPAVDEDLIWMVRRRGLSQEDKQLVRTDRNRTGSAPGIDEGFREEEPTKNALEN